MPPEFGRDVDRLASSAVAARRDGEPPDAAGELADAVNFLRSRPPVRSPQAVVFERLDFRPLRIAH